MMVDENKIKLMTKMAMYEEHDGQKDMKISEYYRKDYTSYHTIASVLWATIGYFLVIALLGVAYANDIIEKLSTAFLIATGAGVVIGWIIVVLVYGMIAYGVFQKRHNNARARVKKYNRDLIRLMKMHDREKK